MVKNMINYDEQEYYSSNDEYDSEYCNDDDPLYQILFSEISNEELDYMNENYPGKYIGDIPRKVPKVIGFKPKRITCEKFKLEPLINKFFYQKDEQKTLKDEQQKDEQKTFKKTWNDNNITFKEKNENPEFPSIGNMISKIKSKKLEINKEEIKEWTEVKKKDKKKVCSPSSSLNSFKTSTTSSSDSSFTKLCDYFMKKQDCPHKNRCRYAHSEEQLIIKNCSFDKDCKFLKYKDNSEKICKYIHSFETKEEYFNRIRNKEDKDIKLPSKENIEKKSIESIEVNKYNYTKKTINDIYTPSVKEVIIDVKEDEWIQVKIPKTKNEKSRDKAFDILSDKDKLKDKLKRTKLCLSVINKTTCPHKNNCRYAHNIQELTIRECLFQDDCNYIKKEKINNNYVYRNVSKTKICESKHKDEKLNNYYERIGLNTVKKITLK
jgi:hypothetical protein